MPTREKYRRDDKENQLLAAFIQIKTWIQPGFKVEITPLVISAILSFKSNYILSNAMLFNFLPKEIRANDDFEAFKSFLDYFF